MVFIIKPIGAELAEDHDFLGKSDPYCIIHIGGQKFTTKPHSGAGKKPKWTEAFTFNGNANDLKVEVYDEDTGKDDFYGEGTLNLSKWLQNPGKAQTDAVEIHQKKKKTGIVTISIEYQGPAIGGTQQNQGGWASSSNQPQNSSGFGNPNNPGNLGY